MSSSALVQADNRLKLSRSASIATHTHIVSHTRSQYTHHISSLACSLFFKNKRPCWAFARSLEYLSDINATYRRLTDLSHLCGNLCYIVYINLLLFTVNVWMFIPWCYLFIVGFLRFHYVGASRMSSCSLGRAGLTIWAKAISFENYSVFNWVSLKS